MNRSNNADHPLFEGEEKKEDLGSSGVTAVPSRRHGGVLGLSSSYDLRYPFARSSYSAWDGDESGNGYVERPTWKPGVRHADKGEGDVESIADGFGRIILTVVSTHKPGRYPMRVFFTREWVNPDGKRFGKLACRVTTLAHFRALTRGYCHEFVLAGCKCEGCRWPHHDHRYGEELEAERAHPVQCVPASVGEHPEARARPMGNLTNSPDHDRVEEQTPNMTDAAEMLWVVLANVSGGDWSKQTPEWQEVAARWRDNYFAALKAASTPLASRDHPTPDSREYTAFINGFEAGANMAGVYSAQDAWEDYSKQGDHPTPEAQD